MVCMGNICRSPLAHGIMDHLVKELGLNWDIDSAGTGNWHVGELPDSRAIAVAKKYGIDISSQCCRQFHVEDFDKYDSIYVMDYNNLNIVIGLAKKAEDRKKVKLLLGEAIVPDPYYDDTKFESVFKMIEQGCKEIFRDAQLLKEA